MEDLHDADRDTLDMLTHVSRNLTGSRVLILGTYRDVEVTKSHDLTRSLAVLGRISGFKRIPLSGLTVDQVHGLMSHVAGQEVPHILAEVVHDQTEGTPLFVREVVRYLKDQGLLTRRGPILSTAK